MAKQKNENPYAEQPYDVGYGKPPKGHQFKQGQSGNRKGRPPKKFRANYDQSDIQNFGNTVVEVGANGRVETMNRRTALLFKMFESAMKGSVSMQRFLYQEFTRNAKLLAETRLRYEQLMIKWVIENQDFDGLDGKNIPFEVQIEIAGLESVLNHYYPTQYPRGSWTAEDDDTE